MINWPDDEQKKEVIEEFTQDPTNPYIKYPKNRVETPKPTQSPTGESLKASPWPLVGLSKVLENLNVDNLVDAMDKVRLDKK